MQSIETLKRSIELTREDLNDAINNDPKVVLRLSRRLDKMILDYHKMAHSEDLKKVSVR